MTRILVVDDHHVVRAGIARLLAEEDDFEVVAEAQDGTEVEALLDNEAPDLMVLDMSMPGMDGEAVLESLTSRQSPPAVVVLSMQDEPAAVERALALGAQGYVLKQTVADELVAAVRAAHRGGVYLCAEVAAAFRGAPAEPELSLIDELSPRERQVAELIVAGRSTKQIAAAFKTSLKTVQKQRQAAMRKLDAPNTASFVRRCMELGIDGEPTK